MVSDILVDLHVFHSSQKSLGKTSDSFDLPETMTQMGVCTDLTNILSNAFFF